MKSCYKSLFIMLVLLLTGSLAFGSIAKIKQLRAAQDKRINELLHLSKTLKNMARRPLPHWLILVQLKQAKEYNRWLMRTAKKTKRFAMSWKKRFARFDKGSSSSSTPGSSPGGAKGSMAPQAAGGSQPSQLMRSTKEMQEMNQSFKLQYLALKQKMQGDNRKFTTISNIMKIKHDTAKAAINNIR